jgi:hypothetical protein
MRTEMAVAVETIVTTDEAEMVGTIVMTAITAEMAVIEMYVITLAMQQSGLTCFQLYDQLFGSDYECILQGDSNREERRGADNCCRQAGGEQYELEGRVSA